MAFISFSLVRHLAAGAAMALALSAPLASVALGAGPSPATPTMLSRQNLAVAGSLNPADSASYTVDYQPQLEGGGKLAPWLLRMNFSAPGASPNSLGFSWLDQTNAAASGSTNGNTGKSETPQIGGNMTDVPAGTDTGTIQQAVLSGGAPGTFAITVSDGSNVPASYTLQLFPMVGGKLEPGINPNPVPAAAPPPQAAPAPAQAPAPAAPAQPQPGNVSIDDTQGFSPNTVTIKGGQTVTWTNRGANVHTVTADDGAFDSGGLDNGKSFSRTFQNPGTYPYHSETDVTYNSDGTKNFLFKGTVVAQ